MIFLTGSNGQVGYELRSTLAPLGPVLATTRDTLDLTNEQAIRDAVRAAAPRLIVNAAAYTAVDAAESDEAACAWLNTEVPRILAEEAARCGAWLVHYSTDYVFDGAATRPYREDDPVNPLGVYGRTKAAGEAAVRAACGRHLILRVAWVYGTRGKNFLKTIQRLAATGNPLRIVHDQVGVPTWSRAIAEVTTQAAACMLTHGNVEHLAGTYHLAAEGACSWYEFAAEILRHHAARGHATPDIHPISAAEYPTPAKRPAYSVLDPSKIGAAFRITLPSWRTQLRSCLA